MSPSSEYGESNLVIDLVRQKTIIIQRPGTQGATGPQGAQGDPGVALENIDGGTASSIYGGTNPIDGGGA